MHETVWLASRIAGDEAAAVAVVERYTHRLIGLARKQLPARLQGRVAPEDVVQSVYRSFFRRLGEGQFTFQDADDMWRLLAVMTCHRVVSKVTYHQQARRDVRREGGAAADSIAPAIDERTPGPEDLAIFFESLELLVNGLPGRFQEIVRLRLEGYEIEQIAEQIGCSRRTVFRVLGNVREAAIRHLEQT